MAASRKIPSFRKKDSFVVLGLAAVFPLLGSFLCCFASFSTPKHTFSEWLNFLLVLLLSTGLLLTAILLFYQAITIFREKRSWFTSAATAEANIVKRWEVENDPAEVDYAFSYGISMPNKYWYLSLKLIPAQLRIMPSETLISFAISESQYRMYAGRTSVTIYYSTRDPFAFLLEDEI